MKNVLLLIVAMSISVFAYGQRTISGTVTDTEGEPLIGANVIVVGNADFGTITDFDGKYELNVPDDAKQIEVRYIGFETQVIDLGPGDVYDLELSSGVQLDEAVIVAYGEQSQRTLVSSISTLDQEQISGVPAVGPQEVLQGQASGVQMVNSSGQLGAAPNIRIRGVASITGDGNPLFVVDGVPLNNETNNYSDDYGGSTGLNPLMNLSMDDIESMSVLKDAAAAALYGSRGSNGVILITTKKGKAGTNRVNFSSTYGTGTYTDLYDMANTTEFQTIRDRYLQSGVDENPNFFDWQDAVLQDASTWRNSLSISGGTEKTQYYLGGSYNQDQSYVIGNDLERYSGRLNLTHNVSDNFKFGANINLSRASSDRISVENSTFAPLTSSYLQDPAVNAFTEEGAFARTGFIANVIAIEETSITDFVLKRSTGNTYLQYTIPNVGAGRIILKTDWGIDLLQTEETFRYPDIISPGGSGSFSVIQDNKWLTTNTIRYAADLGSGINFSILGGQSFETSRFERTDVGATGFAADDLRNVNSGAQPTTTNAARSEWSLASFFGRGTVNYQNRYFLEASIRTDGSSRFGANNRWGTFWAVGAGWDLTQESFMESQNIFNQLKLRASYGITGNQPGALFAPLGLFEGGTASDYGGNAGLRPIQAGNPDLQWEETAQFDIGINARLFNRVNLNVAYYNKNTTDLILEVPLPYNSGIASIIQNVGEMNNTGVDIDLGVDIVNTNDLSVYFGGNISFVNNEVTDLGEAASFDADGNAFIGGSASQRAVQGRTVNEFFLIRYSGINPETGDAEWLDKEGNPTIDPTANDRVFVGSAIPDFVGGVNFNVTYKGLSLSALANYTYGNFVMLDGLRFTENPVSGFNKSRDLLNAWEQPGDQAFAPGAESPTAFTFSQRSTSQLQDGSFLRLRNVTLAYNLPMRKWGVDFVENLRVFARGINLLTWTASDFRGQDPEVSDSGTNNQVQGESFFVIPQRKMYEFGLNVTF